MAMSYEKIGQISFDNMTIDPGDRIKSDDCNIEGEVLEIVLLSDERHLLVETDFDGLYFVDAYAVYEVNGVDYSDPSDGGV